jgi:uncharacterized damage-inducible protein DinB
MSHVPAWFERKFEFHFPVGLYPNVVIRLRGTPARIEELLGGASTALLRRKPDGRWSAQEHAGHLLDMEPLWLARLEDFLIGKETLTPADLGNRRTHEANYNARELRDILHAFRAARAQLLARLEQVEPEKFGLTLVHPRLKQPMRLVDHLFFMAEHDDHHLAVIWELTSLKSPGSQ